MTKIDSGILGAIIGSVLMMVWLSFCVWWQTGGYWTIKGAWSRLIEKIKTGKGKVF